MQNKEQIIHDMEIRLEILCGLNKIAKEVNATTFFMIIERRIKELESQLRELYND